MSVQATDVGQLVDDVSRGLVKNRALSSHFDVSIGQLQQPLLQSNHLDGFALVDAFSQFQMRQVFCALSLTYELLEKYTKQSRPGP